MLAILPGLDAGDAPRAIRLWPEAVQYFSIAYYVAADVGCLAVGFLVRWLAGRGFSVHRARMTVFAFCTLLTAMSMLVAFLPASWLFLAILLVVGFGSLGQFPMYYAFTQELSVSRMGRVTGTLSFLTWTSTALVQEPIGRWVDRTHSYSEVTFLAGLLPMIGFLALLLLWDREAGQAVMKVIDPNSDPLRSVHDSSLRRSLAMAAVPGLPLAAGHRARVRPRARRARSRPRSCWPTRS